MFKRLPDADARPAVTIYLDGAPVGAREGDTVSAAMLAAGVGRTRTTPVSGAPRLPYCMMGVCFDCLMEIDGVPNRQACQVRVRDGMQVRRQEGARGVTA
jgi:predicted molibdopterin-dependent oxidoreductase YjgC